MSELRFGIGGLPHTNKGKLAEGIQRLHELGLQHLELEFVQSVYVKEEKAPEVKQVAEENDITLSVHGSYYINMAAEDPQKWYAGISRVVKAAQIGALCGAKSITYHSGFFQGQTFEEAKPRVEAGMIKVFTELEKSESDIKIAPELTGKESQVGDLEELIAIVQDLRGDHPNASLCIDFAHKYARSGGKFNSYDEFMQIIEAINSNLGEDYIKQLHIHVSGIEFGDKGEKNHLVFLPSLEAYKAEGIEVEGIEKAWGELKSNRMGENKFNWQDLLKAFKASGVGGYVVCESPILELDSLLMQQYYKSL